MEKQILFLPIHQLLKTHPYANDFFSSFNLQLDCDQLTLEEYLSSLPKEIWEELELEKDQFLKQFLTFLDSMLKINLPAVPPVQSITILGGIDKNGEPENVTLTMQTGEIICLVGPTGSGKSRLLGDIEWMAQRDTPTQRQILINQQVPSKHQRFSLEHKLVAQLSQNMNFVMDLTVGEFITIHAESRLVEEIEETVSLILEKANQLAGEKFSRDTAITALSGGQSRALMIADTAYLSTSPIVLIDEIENAGIDRQEALNLLVSTEKIVLLATHDPLLALLGHKRLVLKNGGIRRIIQTTKEEKDNLSFLEKLDTKLLELRNQLRHGYLIKGNLRDYFREEC